jgi:hypothetical protein
MTRSEGEKRDNCFSSLLLIFSVHSKTEMNEWQVLFCILKASVYWYKVCLLGFLQTKLNCWPLLKNEHHFLMRHLGLKGKCIEPKTELTQPSLTKLGLSKFVKHTLGVNFTKLFCQANPGGIQCSISPTKLNSKIRSIFAKSESRSVCVQFTDLGLPKKFFWAKKPR